MPEEPSRVLYLLAGVALAGVVILIGLYVVAGWFDRMWR